MKITRPPTAGSPPTVRSRAVLPKTALELSRSVPSSVVTAIVPKDPTNEHSPPELTSVTLVALNMAATSADVTRVHAEVPGRPLGIERPPDGMLIGGIEGILSGGSVKPGPPTPPQPATIAAAKRSETVRRMFSPYLSVLPGPRLLGSHGGAVNTAHQRWLTSARRPSYSTRTLADRFGKAGVPATRAYHAGVSREPLADLSRLHAIVPARGSGVGKSRLGE